MKRFGRLAMVALLLAAALSSRPAAASGTCPAPAGADPALQRVDSRQRLAWIDAHLSETARKARIWTWGWGVGIVAATGANLVPLAFVSADQRIDWYVGAGTTIVGIVPLLIAPLDVIADARALHQEIAQSSAGDDVCRLLADAEARLVRDAANQTDGQRWWLHVGNVVLNTGVGLFLGLGYHHWGAGALNAGTGIAIGEAIILTQPTGSIGDLRSYRAGALGPPATTVSYRMAF
ncbi:MAG TPA: hypothetical protein VFH73_28160 [Polyangia bacterium]|jgi:hypothetical protein|nr:hypothetical protein [Polyangia bacterium]